MKSTSSAEKQRSYEAVQQCLHKSLVLFQQCSNTSSAPLHTLCILLFILRWTSCPMASPLIDSVLCMTTTEARVLMSPCSVIPHTPLLSWRLIWLPASMIPCSQRKQRFALSIQLGTFLIVTALFIVVWATYGENNVTELPDSVSHWTVFEHAFLSVL